MQRELKLPDVGEGIAEGEIISWLVEPGDRITEDQPLVEVETDKAIVEVPSPIDGTIEALHAKEGEIVSVGSVIVTFETDTDSSNEDFGNVDDATSNNESSNSQRKSGTDDNLSDNEVKSDTVHTTVPASQVVAPPRVKRLARELGVEIGMIPGSANGKPITEADVRAAVQGTRSTPAERQHDEETPKTGITAVSPKQSTASGIAQGDSNGRITTAEPTGTAGDREKTLAAPATRQLARELGVDIENVPSSEERNGHPVVTRTDVAEFNEGNTATQSGLTLNTVDEQTETANQREEHIPYRGIRRTIGERMAEAKYTAPHVSHHDSVDVTKLTAIRQDLSDEVGDDASLTYLPFVMKAVVAALQDYPEMNAVLDDDNEKIIQKHYYNIGIATATESGLMVPVIRDVDEKGVAQLAYEINDIVDRARTRDITSEEMQGGTFTITNFGAIGGDHATPIINYPEAAILGLGTIKDRPVVVHNEVVPRKTLPLSLSVDHRLIDGAVAASFTNDLKRSLKNPARMLL